MNEALPAFVGIGALKAGTTYLDALLRTHPGITMPHTMKEVQFFTEHHARGPGWYAEQFRGDEGRLRGEISPQYLAGEECPERMARMLPDAKLILIVRDPAERAYSQYKHWVQETGYQKDFDTFLEEHPSGIDRGRYWTHLQRYLRHYSPDRVHVIVFEELVADPAAQLRELHAFLGVDPGHVPPNIGEAANVSGDPRFRFAYVQAKRLSRWLYARGQGRLVTVVKRIPVTSLVAAKTATSLPPMSRATAAALAETYAAEVEGLSGFLGRDLTGAWSPRRVSMQDV